MTNPIPTERGVLRSEYIRRFHQYRDAGMRSKSSARALNAMWQFYNGSAGLIPELDALTEAYAGVPTGTGQEDALRTMLAVRPTPVVRDDLPEDPTTEPDFPQSDEDDVLLARVQTMVNLDINAMRGLTIEAAHHLLADYTDASTIYGRRIAAAGKAYQQLHDLLHDTMNTAQANR